MEGMGFAIPVSEAQDIINSLMNKETRTEVAEEDASWLGIQGVDINSSNAQMYNMPEGVYVYSIVENDRQPAQTCRREISLQRLKVQEYPVWMSFRHSFPITLEERQWS